MPVITPTGGGGGGSVTPPVTLAGTDPNTYVLRLVYPPGQSVLAFRVEDDLGNLLVDIDELGKIDTKSFNVQNPPDTGGPDGVVGAQPGRLTIVPPAAGDPIAFVVQEIGALNTLVAIKSPGHGDVFEVSPFADDVAVQIIQQATPTTNVLEVWDNAFSVLLFAVTVTGGIRATLPLANPGPGLLWNDAGTVKVGT